MTWHDLTSFLNHVTESKIIPNFYMILLAYWISQNKTRCPNFLEHRILKKKKYVFHERLIIIYIMLKQWEKLHPASSKVEFFYHYHNQQQGKIFPKRGIFFAVQINEKYFLHFLSSGSFSNLHQEWRKNSPKVEIVCKNLK